MIGRFGEVVLMDWGIAKASAPVAASEPKQEHATPRGELIGTAAHFAGC